MLPVRPSKVDVALLYDDYTPFSYAILLERLGMIFGDKEEVGLGMHEDGVFGVIRIGPIFVQVSQNPGPLGPEGFAGALASPFTQKNCPEAQRLVKAHRKNIFITVGDSDILTSAVRESALSANLADIMGDDFLAPKTPPKEAFSNWMFVAQMVRNQVSSIAKPTLIHWCQSDQLFMPNQLDMISDPRDMKTQIHPNLFSSGHDAAGNQLVGYHAFGSEHVTGHHVIVQETPLLFAEVRSAVDDFIYALSKSSDVPANGQIITLQTGAKLRVRTIPANDVFPRQYLSVEVLEIGNGVAQQEASEQKLKSAFDDVMRAGAKPVRETPKTAIKKPFAKTFFGQGAIAFAILLALGLTKGVLVLGAWFLWTKYRPAKT